MPGLARRLAVIAATAALTTAVAGSAGAQPVDAGLMWGDAQAYPGYTLSGATQNVFLNLNGVSAARLTFSCQSTDTVEYTGSYLLGFGNGHLTCGGIGYSVGTFTYTRAGTAVLMTGNFDGTQWTGPFTGACVLEPRTLPTITAYNLICAVTFGVV